MRFVCVSAASAAAMFAVLTAHAMAQQAPTPAQGSNQLPPVDVIQKQPATAPAAKKKAAAKKQNAPTPQVSTPASATAGPTRTPDGRVVDRAPNLSPINPSGGILPSNLQDYIGAGTQVSNQEINQQHPKDNHEILSRVPGVLVVNDDGMARHSGIGMRGSPIRRSRKVLVLEDGQSINFSSYIDPSTHYTPPTERIESVQVVRGYNIPFAPLTNHGVVNFQNLNPFGPDETVISGSIGTTEGANKSVNNTRHVHTRQHAGNVGVVASYTGSDAGGAWDSEVLRYNDFYGAIGWKGTDQDLVLSGVYFRQRDNYDEANFIGTEADFFANRRSKQANGTYFDAGNSLNSYNADYYRLQATHNLYIDKDTTLTTRAYGHDNERNRYETSDDGPILNPASGFMFGRERHYRYYGLDSRIEFANLPLFGGMTHDVQAGVNYEWHAFRNCNSTGLVGQVLDADTGGSCRVRAGDIPPYGDSRSRFEKYESEAFTAFVQSAIHVTRDFTLTPGLRFVDYTVDKEAILRVSPSVTDGTRLSSSHDHVLPGIAAAWEFVPQTTLYGGYHRGFTPSVARGEVFPLPDEIGDNYQIGMRTSAIRGLSLDFAYFHSRIDDYQIKGAYQIGNPPVQVFGTVDEAEINGFEIYSRLDSQPLTGGHLNFFGEAVYTFSGTEITKSRVASEVGNWLPEVPRNVAALTVGVEEKGLWDASFTWTYRGEFFTDTANTAQMSCVNEDGDIDATCTIDDLEGVVGKVPDVWLLSARASYTIPNSGMTLFVSGQNLENKFYISDFADGAKPGIGRTLWAGFKYKLQ